MARVRISAGDFKGRALGGRKVFACRAAGDSLRPTSAKVREALFDILQFRIKGAVFVDLYAGTGAVGIEALSRGARKVIFVESNRVRSRAIADFLRKNNLSDRAEVFCGKAEEFLRREASFGEFGIVFADPPYGSDELERIAGFFDMNACLLPEDFCLMAEHDSKKAVPQSTEHLEVRKRYKYGDTMVTWYARKNA